MNSPKEIKYKLYHCDIIGHLLEDIVPTNLLQKYRFVPSQKPDYVFYSVTDRPEIFTNYPNAIKIFISGEPVSPAFTFFDYCIGMDDIVFGDRYFYYPDFIRTSLTNSLPLEKKVFDAGTVLASKTSFMDYVQSHDRPDLLREKLVRLFESYKRVSCAGAHLHNCDADVSNYHKKIAFQSRHKFSLVVEASDHPHFITEKIIHSFIANTIPVYYGPRDIGTTINPKSFVCLNGMTEEEMLAEIIRLDNDDDAYKACLQEDVFVDSNFIKQRIQGYEEFLDNIFIQPKDRAFRRERWNYEERMRKMLKRSTLILPTKDRLSSLKHKLVKK